MQEIVEKYDNTQSCYLLPIINPLKDVEERKQYIYKAHNVNRNLKIIGNALQLPLPLTIYVSRHTWASIAKSKNIPISIISEGMGHDSEKLHASIWHLWIP
jgi:integrase